MLGGYMSPAAKSANSRKVLSQASHLSSIVIVEVPSRMWLEFVWRNLRYDEVI